MLDSKGPFVRLSPAARREVGRLLSETSGADTALLLRPEDGVDRLHRVELSGDPGELWTVVPADPVPVVLPREDADRYAGALIHFDRRGGGFRVELAHSDVDVMRDRVAQVLTEVVNPLIESHGGRIEMAGVSLSRIEVRMEGGCHGCASADGTLAQIVQRAIRFAVPGIFEIVDVTEHETGENPWISRSRKRGTALPIFDAEALRAAAGMTSNCG